MSEGGDQPHVPWRHRLKNGATAGDPNSAPRCGAHARTTGAPCKAPAIKGKRRCRLHGGRSTGPRTLSGLARSKSANLRHGEYSRESQTIRKLGRMLAMNYKKPKF